MTGFQLTVMWGLRAAVAFALFEGGLAAGDAVQAGLSALERDRQHVQVLQRLERRAQALETRARTRATWTERALPLTKTQKRDIAATLTQMLRTPLTNAGAQDLRIKGAIRDPTAGFSILEGELSWAEPREAASRTLRALDASMPNLSVRNVSLVLERDGRVRTTVGFVMLARTT